MPNETDTVRGIQGHPDLPGPPNTPPTTQMPPEYWRKNPAGDPDHGQYQTVERGRDDVVKVPVEPGWDNPVHFGPEGDGNDA
ncbi:hypothetical protein BI081_gp236 [Mycobacterium phage Tonenili]|uniref:Uncharacterized protein n=1 Tax=Mycobacterium phage Tonenili TaxID=1891703 RepID=A0A1C9EHB1_9CAUD|nr:hypothetical protein BI081_gp236 [Mycobacterium phage Tonenili]AON96871.1 hypothetical protein SEA_TONENILI_124 [Mycobacterium phage Tonenili]